MGMNEYWIAAIVVGWAVCGFLAYGRDFAHFQRKWPTLAKDDRRKDRRMALLTSMGGPITLIIMLFICKHGFMWRSPRNYKP